MQLKQGGHGNSLTVLLTLNRLVNMISLFYFIFFKPGFYTLQERV